MAQKPRPGRTGKAPALPSREQLLAYLAEAEGKIGKREIARAFGLKGADRIELKRLLAELTDEGVLAGNRKRIKRRGTLPPTCVVEVTGRDRDGELVAEPVEWPEDDGARPRVLVEAPRSGRIGGEPVPGIGDRLLVRVRAAEGGEASVEYIGHPLRVLPRDKVRALGIFRAHVRGGGEIMPVDRRAMRTWVVRADHAGDAADGDLVRFDLSRSARHSVPEARIAEVLGNPADQRKVSLVAVHAHGIPDEFPAAVIAEADRLLPPPLGGRKDLRDLPLVTIDPEDARDHDDAVWAADDPDPANKGGHVVVVAIADVAWFVRPGTRLDREASKRGNSVYFPDRVVPMLPERLSADLCSLREGEERAALAVRMVFDKAGRKRSHAFERVLMRSAAKLTYQEAQAAVDGRPSKRTRALVEPVLRPLWAAYEALGRAREVRGPLDLDLPERRIVLDARGRVERVIVPERLAAHRLIEEFMIQANVAAAETLESRRAPSVFRVHDKPAREKLEALAEFLASLGMRVPSGTGLKPTHFNAVLAQAKSMPSADLVNEVVLRSQAQAVYATENIGHFGLNLPRYAHFTSPIRRYADLLVHRALIGALGLGEGGVGGEMAEGLGDVARTISEAERRAMAAERETIDRLIAGYLADHVGASFAARVSGVTRSGLFVRLADTGADGFVPASTIGGDYWRHDEPRHALVGDRTGLGFQLGDSVEVRLAEAIPTAGALRFEMLSDGRRLAGAATGRRHISGLRRRGPRGRR